MTLRQLTAKQNDVLLFIRDFVKAKGYPPTRKEIASNFGFNPNAAQAHLVALSKKGFLRVEYGISRGIALVEQATA